MTEPGHVLVADDREAGRQTLCRYVTQLGHRTTPAENGRVALELLRREPFDLVLLDVLMPEMDGLAALEQIKADERLREIPVLMVSGLDEVESVVRCIERGAEDYLTKPLDPVLLRARIGACLEKKRLRDAERQRTEELERTLLRLRAAQDQLVVQEKLASLGVLTAGIAHEIRNPLNFVTNFAQLAQELANEVRALAPGGTAELGEVLDGLSQSVAKIREHGNRAAQIVSTMLLFARGETGERRPANLNALVEEYVGLAYHAFHSGAAGPRVTLEKDFDPAVGQVAVVAEELGRVFLNLTHNACQAVAARRAAEGPTYMPRLLVTTRSAESAVEVRFRDNGPGVPAELHEKIFTPFFSTKPPGSGTGLGLSISYDVVVRLHDGSLRVESVEGEFAEFIVTLPR